MFSICVHRPLYGLVLAEPGDLRPCRVSFVYFLYNYHLDLDHCSKWTNIICCSTAPSTVPFELCIPVFLGVLIQYQTFFASCESYARGGFMRTKRVCIP